MLRLKSDGAPTGMPLEDYLPRDCPAEIVRAIAQAVPPLAARLAAGRLYGDPSAIVGVNNSGDRQKALDLGAHDYMLAALRAAGVRQVLSEEAEAVINLNPGAAYDVAIDPIDGSGSIGIGAPLGLLFTVLPAAPEGFLRTGRSIIAAGYVSFGHSCDFGFSLGQGTHVATLDPSQSRFRLTHEKLLLPAEAKIIAYNASNERHWHPGLQAWARDLRLGKDGPRGRDFNMRWLAAAVGELHRILLLGGCFFYPSDQRKGYESGRLRTLYEACPIAFLIEQVGGAATDGLTPILDRLPQSHHENTPLVFGCTDEVATIARYLSQ